MTVSGQKGRRYGAGSGKDKSKIHNPSRSVDKNRWLGETFWSLWTRQWIKTDEFTGYLRPDVIRSNPLVILSP